MSETSPTSTAGNQGRRSAAILVTIVVFGLGVFYSAIVIALLQAHGPFLGAGGDDYRAYRAAAEVARDEGFARVYDLDALRWRQESLVQEYSDPALIPNNFAVMPTPYPPFFVAFFEPMLLFPPVPGFIAWTAVNVAAMVAYLFWFQRRIGGAGGGGLAWAFVLSFPAIDTFQWGQVNVFLLIFFGEFFRLAISGSELRAGIWLSGMLLKPQTLMVILPGLLIARRWRALAGFAAGSAGILAISLALGGVDAIVANAQVMFMFSGPLPSTTPEYMMNWRSLAIYLAQIISPQVAWGLAMVGLVGTYAGALSLWLLRSSAWSGALAVLLLGSYAATCSVAWHSHAHMSLPLCIPLLYLVRHRLIPLKLVALWLLSPYLAIVTRMLDLNPSQTGMLIAHMCLLVWSGMVLWKERGDLGEATSPREADHLRDRSVLSGA